eukprot:12428924-Alexandrium_andersonii.AAC.1
MGSLPPCHLHWAGPPARGRHPRGVAAVATGSSCPRRAAASLCNGGCSYGVPLSGPIPRPCHLARVPPPGAPPATPPWLCRDTW